MNELIIKFMKSLDNEEKQKYFCMEPSEKTIGMPTPSPRSWEIVSNLLNLNVDDLTLLEMISGAVGKDAAQKFVTFRSTYQGYSLKYILYGEPGKPFNFKELTEKNVAKLSLELKDLIDNDFKDHNINDIFMRVGDLINYLLTFKEYIKVIFNLNNFGNKSKFKNIMKLYEEQTTINLIDKILEVLI